jgi:hypothetical protein
MKQNIFSSRLRLGMHEASRRRSQANLIDQGVQGSFSSGYGDMDQHLALLPKGMLKGQTLVGLEGASVDADD